MKSHLEIAKELYLKYNNMRLGLKVMNLERMRQHSQDCQVFLDFLEVHFHNIRVARKSIPGLQVLQYPVETQMEDIQVTLKFYKEKGVIS